MRSSESSSKITGKDRRRSRSKSLKQGSGTSNSVNSTEKISYQRVINQAEMDKKRLQRELEASREKEESERARVKVLEDKAIAKKLERAREKELKGKELKADGQEKNKRTEETSGSVDRGRKRIKPAETSEETLSDSSSNESERGETLAREISTQRRDKFFGNEEIARGETIRQRVERDKN